MCVVTVDEHSTRHTRVSKMRSRLDGLEAPSIKALPSLIWLIFSCLINVKDNQINNGALFQFSLSLLYPKWPPGVRIVTEMRVY